MRFLIEALPGLAVLALIIWVVSLVVGRWSAARLRRADAHAPWRAVTRSAGPHQLVVEVTRPGEEAQPIAELDPALDGFEDRLAEAESRATSAAAALNAGRR